MQYEIKSKIWLVKKGFLDSLFWNTNCELLERDTESRTEERNGSFPLQSVTQNLLWSETFQNLWNWVRFCCLSFYHNTHSTGFQYFRDFFFLKYKTWEHRTLYFQSRSQEPYDLKASCNAYRNRSSRYMFHGVIHLALVVEKRRKRLGKADF